MSIDPAALSTATTTLRCLATTPTPAVIPAGPPPIAEFFAAAAAATTAHTEQVSRLGAFASAAADTVDSVVTAVTDQEQHVQVALHREVV
ncbi:hypothetical protein KRX51_02350 [Corynebacterium sp. TAE3-ERU12]|uniref:hypothetical protein n=1 Tax=Corynebacterium sp. TAE3-ERU12 TaxID=2849491 RepID=UPI001C481ED3|nr:hypothetical protein [Corynebacterium sp. TAE3-ERU12]MBV7294761.1 hypothetical protein [Corynebacterium sp. TAE3-ERU12]